MEATNATAEVNEFRSKKGLPAFEEDLCLVEAAKACALVRAEKHHAGHTKNDFLYLPEGCRADAAGCAAMTPDWGWHSCCDSEAWKYGGAAVVMSEDGMRYMHLFVRETVGRVRAWLPYDQTGEVQHHPRDTKCFAIQWP